MIIFKADAMIKAVFTKTIKVMGEDIEWNELIVVNNNSIILPGKRRSIIFSFDNSKVLNTIVDLDIKEMDARLMCNNSLLENAFNMLLYIFGKWGQIKGLTVEKNVKQLEMLIKSILSDVEVEAQIRGNRCQFYKGGMKYTYEDIIQDILDLMNPEQEDESEEDANADQESADGAEHTDRRKIDDEISEEGGKNRRSLKSRLKIGLWHRMVWKSSQETFEKNDLPKKDRFKIRMGRGFYGTGYNCPECKEILYMVVYPIGKEFRIETDEKPVRLARAYTCSDCLTFFTPKPNLLIGEGLVYRLDFDDDKAAYEDYIDLIGADGERISNCNFNVYEADYHMRSDQEIREYERQQEEADHAELEQICESIEAYPDDKLYSVAEKLEEEFYSEGNERRYGEQIRKEARRRRQRVTEAVKKFITKQDEERFLGYVNSKDEKRFTEESRKMKEEQLEELDDTIQLSPKLEKKTKERFTSILRSILGEKQQKSMLVKAAGVREKPFEEVASSYRELNTQKCDEKVKAPILNVMKEWLRDKGRKELKQIEDNIPEHISKQQYDSMIKKVKDYSGMASEAGLEEELDTDGVIRRIREKRDQAEKQEIETFIQKNGVRLRKSYGTGTGMGDLKAVDPKTVDSKTVGPKTVDSKTVDPKTVDSKTGFKDDRKVSGSAADDQKAGRYNLKRKDAVDPISYGRKIKEAYRGLKEGGYEEHNVKPYLDDLYDSIYEIDKAAIEKLCPDIMEMTYDEGIEAYKKIDEGDFLPELKVDVLKQINDRLRAMKRDECISLVKKFSRDMGYNKGYSGLHMYDPRTMTDTQNQDSDAIAVRNALNSYGVTQKYEYPIMICDYSHGGNGKKGFVLTPDNIYFNCGMSSGALRVPKIGKIYTESGLLNKGIYAEYDGGGSYKISNMPKFDNGNSGVEHFVSALNAFLDYLKEKPESRSLEYMVKEKHAVKCCYRCGFVYKTGDVCPKCGSKNNS